jgi:hypothetical protein
MLASGNIVRACRRCCESDLIGFSFTPVTGMSRNMFILSAMNHAAKFWLAPVILQRSGSFSRSEINRIRVLVEEQGEMLARSWNEYFNR